MFEKNIVVCIDCIDGMKQIPDGYVDAIITDLPFGCTQNHWDHPIDFQKMWEQFNRVKKISTPVILFGQGMFTADLMQSNRKYWKYNLVWEKSTVTGFLNANRQPLRSHEDIVIFYEKQPTYNPQKVAGSPNHSRGNKNPQSSNYNSYSAHDSDPLDNMKHPRSVLKFDTVPPSLKTHPTEKPVPLLEYLIKTYTNKGDVVLDCCCGAGSTLVSCRKTARDYIGFDTSEEYIATTESKLSLVGLEHV